MPAKDFDKLRTLIQALDLHLALGKPAPRALAEAVEDYAFVFYPSTGSGQADSRHPIERKKERVRERKNAG